MNCSVRAFWNAVNERVVQALMRALSVIVLHVLIDRTPEVPFAEEHHSIETFRLDREHEPLGEGVSGLGSAPAA